MNTNTMNHSVETMSTYAAPVQLERHEHNPILSPTPETPWESLVTTNPAAWHDPDTDKIYLLYRAAGDDAEHRVYLGLASSDDGYHFKRLASEPVFAPSEDGFDAGCVEDPRVVKIDDYYYITYAARSQPPGEYWKGTEARFQPETMPADSPACLRNNSTVTGLAITRDFKHFIRAGRLTDPMVDDRDVILFPEKVAGQWVMIHRPKEWVGDAYGPTHPAMWIRCGNDLFEMGESRLLAQAQQPWEMKVGGNTPPIRTKHGWLTLYHAVGPDKQYRLGALLLDLALPWRVLHRTTGWLLEPSMDYELDGYYPGVVFPCGSIVRNGKLMVYYGGADKYVGVATCDFQSLLDYLLACSP